MISIWGKVGTLTDYNIKYETPSKNLLSLTVVKHCFAQITPFFRFLDRLWLFSCRINLAEKIPVASTKRCQFVTVTGKFSCTFDTVANYRAVFWFHDRLIETGSYTRSHRVVSGRCRCLQRRRSIVGQLYTTSSYVEASSLEAPIWRSPASEWTSTRCSVLILLVKTTTICRNSTATRRTLWGSSCCRLGYAGCAKKPTPLRLTADVLKTPEPICAIFGTLHDHFVLNTSTC